MDNCLHPLNQSGQKLRFADIAKDDLALPAKPGGLFSLLLAFKISAAQLMAVGQQALKAEQPQIAEGAGKQYFHRRSDPCCLGRTAVNA